MLLPSDSNGVRYGYVRRCGIGVDWGMLGVEVRDREAKKFAVFRKLAQCGVDFARGRRALASEPIAGEIGRRWSIVPHQSFSGQAHTRPTLELAGG